MSDKKVYVDEVLDEFGLFQPYHRQVALLMIFAFATNSLYSANYVFAVEEVNYRCVDQNVSAAYCTLNSNGSCSEWVYENPHSLVAEFDLACQDWKRTSVGTVHSLGYMCGLLLVGPISDRIGRKPAIVITGVLGGFFGILRSFSPWYLFYIAMEFLEAALALEIISKKRKSLIVLISNIGYILGNISFALIAWSVPYWRTFLRVLYAPAFLFFFFLILLDESPRWLLIKGRKDRAVAILEKATKKNSMKIDKCILEKLSADVEEGVSFSKLLKETFQSRSLRLRFFICLVWWTTCTFVSYGMTINLVFLQGNKYVNYILSSVADLPASLLITYILQRFKRKRPLIISFLCGAVFCLSQPFISSDLPWLSIVLFIAGKLMSSFYFSITYLYTSELFPTYTRNSMHALCSSLGRIGSIIAPQTPLLIKYWSGLPSFVFGLSALFAGCVTFLVPDIDDASLPDTVHQAEALGKSKELAQTYENCNEGTNISRL